MSEAELFGPQAQKINKNKYTPIWNWIGDKEYDPACLLTLLESSSEEWHTTNISLTDHYTVCLCVCVCVCVCVCAFLDKGRKIKPASQL